MADAATITPNAAGTSPAAAPAPQKPAETKLDDLMLAMDVVDTLRHQQTVATRELDEDGRKADLVERLRKLYAGQGIQVSDRIIEDGVKALDESRFTYKPTPPSLGRTLATLWVMRRTWGLAIAGVVLASGIAIGGYSYFVVGGARRAAEAAHVEITTTLPAQIAKLARTARDEATAPDATARAAALETAGKAAVARADTPAAKATIADLDKLIVALRETYQVRIVTRPNVKSGVWRLPPGRQSRNHYLIVEAIGPDGRALERSVTSEETQVTKTVTLWGQRVPQATFDRVAADKRDDGIIENAGLGEKRRGELAVKWNMPVDTGTITEW